jgi:conjugative transposon protein traE
MVSGAKQFCVTAGKKVKTVVMDPRFVAVMLLLVICTVSVEAQSMESGVKAISTASDSIKKYLPVVTKLIYVIAGIIGVIGIISVYIKMNNEEQDVKKSIMMIVGACIFLIAAAQALPLFFGL